MTQLNKKSIAMFAISISWLFYLYSYIARIEPVILVNELSCEFHINSKTMGYLLTYAYIPYVLMQLPYGIIIDKLGVKAILVISSVICAIGALIFGLADSVVKLNIGRFLIGLAGAPAFLCCGKIASEFFNKRKFPILMGIGAAFGCLGGIIGTTPTAYAVSVFGWRGTTFIIAAIGIIIASLAFIILQPQEKKTELRHKEKTAPNILGGLKILMSDKKIWLLGSYVAISYLSLSAIAELWGVPFMETRFGIPTEKAAMSSMVVLIGFAIGCIVSAWVAGKINSYKKTIILFTIGLTASFSIAFYNDSIGFITCLIAMFFGGFFSGANILCYTIAYNSVPKKFSGTSGGVINTFAMVSGIFFPPLIGKLLDFFRDGKVTNTGSPLYEISVFRNAFLFYMITLIFATIVTFFIRDFNNKQE